MISTGRSRTALLAVLALLGSLLLLVGPAGSAEAAGTGRVRGGIYAAGGTTPKVVMQWFTKDWTYLGKRKQGNGSYSLSLEPGTYWIQFVDQRPAYDVSKAAPANIKVTVRAGRTTTKSVVLRRGAAITGTVKAGGKAAKGARIVAANTAQQSFEVEANGKGQFALGGLPAGSYSVFTYDRSKSYVGKSLWVPKMKAGQAKNVSISLKRKAGRLLVDLYAGSAPLTGRPTVTVVSRSNGQFWSAPVRNGSASFAGLYPGRYKIVVPGVGDYFGSTGAVRGGTVRPGKVGFGSYRLTKRGAWVTGTVIDSSYPNRRLSGASVTLFDAQGARVASTLSNTAGGFSFAGTLTSQAGMKVIVGPGPYSPYLGKDPATCAYINTALATPVRITTGRETKLGAVGVRLKPGQLRAECKVPVS